MPDVNYFKVSDGQDIRVSDIESRASIESLRESKQDTLIAGDNISISENTISSSHPGVPTSDDTTSEQTIPSSGGSFTTVDSVVRDEFGHVRSINIKTVAVPAGGGGGGSGIASVTYDANILTIHFSDSTEMSVALGNGITNLDLVGTDITITYADGTTGILTLTGDSEVTPDSNNFITSGAVYNALISTFTQVSDMIAGKQDELTAGDNITIYGTTINALNTTYSAGRNVEIIGNTINAINTTYSAGDNIGITNHEISAVNTTYSAGANVTIDENNVINAANTTYSFDSTPIENSPNGITSGGVYAAIQSAASSVYEYKGACNRADLPAVGSRVGDVYNLLDASEFGPAGTNVAWNGTQWQILGGAYSAGENITISNSGVISAVNTTYSAGSNITISPQHEISATNTTYTAGENVTIEETTINAVNTTYSAGENVTINGTVISATDTVYTEGDNITFGQDNSINSSHPNIETNEDSSDYANPDFGGTFDVIDVVTRDEDGHVLGVNTTTITLPQAVLTPGANITISDGVISAANTTYSAGENVTIDLNNAINASHLPVDIQGDTTSSISPAAGSTVSMVDSVERDDLGHVTSINVKTMRLPDPGEIHIDVDTVLDPDSHNPVTNAAITAGINSRIAEPEVEGREGQVLTTDGYGHRVWATPGGGGGVDFNTTYVLTNEDGIITLTDSNGQVNEIPMDIAPTQDSTEPITSGAVYDALSHLTYYTAGANINISDEGVISAVNTTYSAGSNITIANGVISATGTMYTFDDTPTDGSLNPVTSDGIYHAIQATAGTTYSAGDNITISAQNVISSQHPAVSTVSDTTDTDAPGPGGTFNVVDSVTRDSHGHVTTINTTEITLPNSQGKLYTLSNESGVLTLTDSDSGTSTVAMDTEPTPSSDAPVTSGGVYTWMINKLANLFGQVAKDTLERFELIAGETYGELRLKDNHASDPFPTKLDFRLMAIPSTITSMYQFLYAASVRDPQANISYYASITKLVLGVDTSSITNMSTCFSGMTALASIDLTGFNTSNVTNMLSMFRNCASLVSLDISSFDMSHVSNMRYFINGCTSLQELDISGCDMSNCHDADQAFSGLSSLVNVITDSDTKMPYWISLDMSASVNLTLQSSINIVNALPTVSSGAYTCTFASAVYTALTGDTEGAAAVTAAQGRGWTVTSA